MNRFKDVDLTRVGLIGLAMIVAVILTGLQFGNLWPVVSGAKYSAVFDDIGGLADGDDVAVSGVKVGTVSGMNLDDGRVVVDFSVDAAVFLGDESTVSVKTSSFLGKRQLEVVSGGDTRMRAGSTVPVERTNSPYSLTDALQGVTTTVRDTDTDSLNDSLTTLSATLDDAAPQLGPTFDGLTALSTTLNSRDESLRDLLTSAGDVTEVLAKRSGQVNTLILNANDLLFVLQQRRDAIARLLASTATVARELDGVVADNEPDLGPALTQLNEFVDMLNANKNNIAESLPLLAKYATNLGEAVGSGPFYDAYVANLIPGPIIQPFINQAFGLPPAPIPFPGVGPPPPESFLRSGGTRSTAGAAGESADAASPGGTPPS